MVLTITPLYYQYWGKTLSNTDNSHEFYLLPYHYLDVAAVGYTFLTSNPQIRKFDLFFDGLKPNIILWISHNNNQLNMAELPIAAVERIAKNNGADRVGADASVILVA